MKDGSCNSQSGYLRQKEEFSSLNVERMEMSFDWVSETKITIPLWLALAQIVGSFPDVVIRPETADSLESNGYNT
jgi:hypothetical protein